MDLNGLWTARFSTGIGAGSGVISLVNGRLLGGDANYYYTGSYREQGQHSVVGELRIVHFFGPLTMVFGPLRELSLTFSGAVGEGLIMAQAQSPVVANMRLDIRLQRVETMTGGT